MKLIGKVEELTIHCTGSDYKRDSGIEVVRRLHTAPKDALVPFGGKHVNGFGWEEIGYHWYINPAGVLRPGRSEIFQGAHVLGHNHNTISICLEGNNKFELIQFRTLLAWIDLKKTQFELTDKAVKGHYSYTDRKTCPNFGVSL